LFEAALDSDRVHAFQHLSFLGAAILFWWALLRARARAVDVGVGMLYLFTTAVHSGLLGALLTFSDTPWYPAYRATTQSWGLSPVEDQQIGGLVMWVPACTVYAGIALALLGRWLTDAPRRAKLPIAVLPVALLLFLALAAPGCSRSGSSPGPYPYWVCVTNERSDDMTVLDGTTRMTIAVIPLGKRPRGIHPSPDGKFLYVALSGSPISGPPGAPGGPPAKTTAGDRSADGIGV